MEVLLAGTGTWELLSINKKPEMRKCLSNASKKKMKI